MISLGTLQVLVNFASSHGYDKKKLEALSGLSSSCDASIMRSESRVGPPAQVPAKWRWHLRRRDSCRWEVAAGLHVEL